MEFDALCRKANLELYFLIVASFLVDLESYGMLVFIKWAMLGWQCRRRLA